MLVAAGKKLSVQVAELDLSDLQSVTNFAKRVKQILNGMPLELLVSLNQSLVSRALGLTCKRPFDSS